MLENKISERAILSALIKDEEIRKRYISELKPAYFSDRLHVQILELLISFYYSGKEITEDIVISAFPEDEKDVEEILLTIASTSASFMHHLTMIKKAYKNRQLLAKINVLKEKLLNGEEIDVRALFEDVEDVFEENIYKPIDEIILSMEKLIEQKKENKDLTGIPSLDRMLITSPGDLIIIGARPSMGKTGLMNTLALNKLTQGKGACIFSLEMPAEKIVARMIANVGLIPMNEINRGLISDFNKYAETKQYLIKNKSKLLIIDHVSDVESIVKIIHQIKMTNPHIDDFFIDHLGFIKTAERFQSEHHKYGYITKSLKKIAKVTGAKIWLLSQLNRGVESKTEKRPSLSDLRESGSIEEDADNVIGLYRPSYYKVKEGKIEYEPDPNELELIILKQRDGPTGIVKTWFSGKYMKVGDNLKGVATEVTIQAPKTDSIDNIDPSEFPDF